MKTGSETPSSEQAISRRDFVSSAVVATAVAATIPAVLPASASAQGTSPRSPLIKLDKRTPQLWQVTIANPPFNLVVPEMVSALHSVVKDMDRDPDVKVIVFKSEIGGFFINHFDLSKARDFPIESTNPALPKVTRALPDKELDAFVEALAARLSGFDKQSLAGAKAQVNRATLPADADFLAAYAEYSQSLTWQGFHARRPRMAKLAAEHGPEELELRLGHYLGVAN